MFTYRPLTKALRTIGEELDVDALLEGEILSGGGTIRIRAQLIDPPTEGHIWSDTYNREEDPSRILLIISDVAQEVVEALRIQLTPQEEVRLASAPQLDPEFLYLYSQGLHARVYGQTATARELLEQAITLDSTYAPAWAALGWAFWSDAVRSKEALDRALGLDPNLPDAYAGLGLYYFWQWNLRESERYFTRALELDPSNVPALYEGGLALFRTGRVLEALEYYQRLRRVDPSNPQYYYAMGDWFYRYLRQPEKHLIQKEYELTLRGITDLNSHAGYQAAEYSLLMQQGNYAEAAVIAEQAFGDSSLQFLEAAWEAGNRERVIAIRDSLQRTGWLHEREQANPIWVARFYHAIGEDEIAITLLEEGQEFHPYALYWAARYRSALGEREKALNLLEEYYKDYPELQRLPGSNRMTNAQGYQTIDLVYSEDFDPLRGEPRFKNLLWQLGLQEVFDDKGNLLQPLPEGF